MIHAFPRIQMIGLRLPASLNRGQARRRRQTGTNSSLLEEIRGEKLMTKIVLSAPPTTPAAEIFSSGDDKEACLRLAMAEAC